jgi:hypothetical protein
LVLTLSVGISHDDILHQKDIMLTLSDVLSSRASSNKQKYALHLLSHLSSSGLSFYFVSTCRNT